MFLSGIMKIKTPSDNSLMNMVCDFPMSVPWAICGEGQEESSTIASQRGAVGWVLFLKTLFLVTNSVWSEAQVTSREDYSILRIALIPIAGCVLPGIACEQADLRCR